MARKKSGGRHGRSSTRKARTAAKRPKAAAARKAGSKRKSALKAAAKRPQKKLVKLPRPKRRPRGAPARVKQTALAKHTRGKQSAHATQLHGKEAHGKTRLKLVRRALSAEEELRINALIARVYQKAAEEMRRIEDATHEAKKTVFEHAAEEAFRMQQMAKEFEGK